MHKPLLIQELEQELNTSFRPVHIEQIMDCEKPHTLYAINEAGKIIGLKIFEFELKELPENIREFTNLKFLNLAYNQISDISALEILTGLTELALWNNPIGNNISALSNLTNLTKLELSNTQLNNIYELSSLSNIIELSIDTNKISDISALRSLTKLKILKLSHNKISNIVALRNLTNIIKLDLSYNKIRDISALSNLTKIEILHSQNNKISNILAVSNFTKLIELNLRNNKVSNISAIQSLIDVKTITFIDLRNNLIEELPRWIVDFPNMDIFCEDNLKWGNIILYNNPIKEPPIEILQQGKKAVRKYFKKNTKSRLVSFIQDKLNLIRRKKQKRYYASIHRRKE